MTELYDRAFFEEILRRECMRCQRTGAAIGLFAARVNDTVSDESLNLIAHAVSNVVRDCDAIARYCGYSFVAMMHEPTQLGIDCLRQRIVEEFDNLNMDLMELSSESTIADSNSVEIDLHEYFSLWLKQLSESQTTT
jgi:GGDEF domain-containing protein